MSEVINIDFSDLKVMSVDALDFFIEEIRQGNSILIFKEARKIEISSIRDWDDFLSSSGILKRDIKKDIRI